MASEIEKTVITNVPVSKTFDRASVDRFDFKQTGVLQVRRILTISDESDVLRKEGAEVDLSVSVQSVIDDLETFLGESPDLETLTMEDFIKSMIHDQCKSEE